jgi:predicted DNA-binding transcriptional regulator AlpA
MAQIGVAEIARVLGVSRPRVWQLRKREDFPPAAGEAGGREFWEEMTILRWAAGAGREMSQRAPALWRHVDPNARPASYLGAVVVEKHVVLRWDTQVGEVALAFPLPGTTIAVTPGEVAPRAARRIRVGDTLVVVLFTSDPWGPSLDAVDRLAPDRAYSPRWTDLAALLGDPAPWWAPNLRRPERILRWTPGARPATIEPITDVDTGPLLRLAASAGEGSVRTTLNWLASRIRERAADAADVQMGDAEDCSDSAAIAVAARPLSAAEGPEPAEVVRRDAWLEILAREDDLAEQCVLAAVAWDSGWDFPFGSTTEVDPVDDAAAARWAEALIRPAARTAAYAVFGAPADDALLYDPRTGLPAVRTARGAIATAVPQRLPTTSPLAEVVFGEHSVYIATEDGSLYLAPESPGLGVSWGYGGSGPHTLAALLDRLIDDPAAPAASRDRTGPPASGLLDLTRHPWPPGTRLTRARLIAARDSSAADGDSSQPEEI